MDNFNNSFPYFNHERESADNDIDLERSNISAFNFNFLKLFESYSNTNANNMFYSPAQKKNNTLDISDSEEQLFCENSQILNIEEELNEEEETCNQLLILISSENWK